MKEDNKEVLLFGGTTEGRLLAGYLMGLGCPLTVCVATEYGGEMLEPLADQDGLLTIQKGRLNREGMVSLMEELAPGLVIDATHPYAAEVTENIKCACAVYPGIRLLRCGRDGTGTDVNLVRVPDVRAAVDWLDKRKGSILVTTGSKELSAFCGLEDYRARVYARVLPSVESVQACRNLGYEGRHIIAMQGPFSVEMNLALLKEFDCRYLVTKDGGKAGGLDEKLEAAGAAGARVVLIDRPGGDEGISLEAVKEQIKEWMDHER